MKRVKITTSNAELEKFLARTDIEIINVDVRSCEQSWFAQEYFTAVIYYDDEPKSEYSPDYWTRLEHQYAGMAMQGMVKRAYNAYCDDCANYENMIFEDAQALLKDHTEALADVCVEFAHALVEKMKEAK